MIKSASILINDANGIQNVLSVLSHRVRRVVQHLLVSGRQHVGDATLFGRRVHEVLPRHERSLVSISGELRPVAAVGRRMHQSAQRVRVSRLIKQVQTHIGFDHETATDVDLTSA